MDGRPLEVDPTQHPYAEALLQQSRALVSFVSHLSSASSDPMAELTGSSSGLGERCSRAREIATGACPAERLVLFEGVPSNSPQTESYDSSSRQPRECGQHKPYDLLGTVWRLWCTARTGSGDVERSSYFRGSAGQQHGCSEGSYGTTCRDAGTSQHGRQSVGSCMDAGPFRRSSSFSMDEPRSFCNGRSQSLCSTLLPTMGHHSPSCAEGAGSVGDKEIRSCPTEAKVKQRAKPRPEAKTKAKAKAAGEQSRSTCQLRHNLARANQKPTAKASAADSPVVPLHAPRTKPGRFEQSGPKFNSKTQPEAFESCDAQPGVSRPSSSSTSAPFSSSDTKWTSDISSFSFSFTDWCMSLCRKALKCRSPFSRFLASTLVLRCDGPKAPSTALFPLPLPSFWPNAPVDPGLSKSSFRSQALMRAMHVVVCALNYTYCSRGTPPLDLLRRQPNEIQLRAFQHLELLLSACDPGLPVEVASSGRKNLQLLARLQESTAAADALGFRESPYHQHASGHQVKVDNSGDPKLSPFSEVRPERLKISGTGHWKAEEHISPEFYMPFLEPKILECDVPVYDRGVPDTAREKPRPFSIS